MIWAVWPAEMTHAMAGAMSGRATTSGTSALMAGFSKAWAAPSRATSPKIVARVCHPPRAPRASATAAAAFTNSHITTISRRSQRSATCPTTRVSTIIGTNCTRPTRPRSSALPVSS